MLGEYCEERGGTVRGHSSLPGHPDIIQPAFPSVYAGSTPMNSTNFGSKPLKIYACFEYYILFCILLVSVTFYLDRVLLCSPEFPM